MSYQPWKREAFKPEKRFTDRESYRQLLENAVATPQPLDTHKVLVFYGAGGQGKSALKENFIQHLETEISYEKPLAYMQLDFEAVERDRQPDDALLRLAEQLIDRYKVALPAFSLGIMRYKKLTTPEKNIESAYPFLFRAKGLKHEVYHEVVSSGFDIIGVPGIGYLIKKGTAKLLEWLQRKDVDQLIGNMDSWPVSKLLDQLPYLFAYDLYQYLETAAEKDPFFRLVVIMDGYESLWRFESNKKNDKDAWIRKMVLALPGVLFVVFGRDRLRWTEVEQDPFFDSFVQQNILKGLKTSDADAYLKAVPIPEAPIREIMIRAAKSRDKDNDCLPFYLSLQVDTYARIKNEGKPLVPEKFGGTQQQIIAHFFEHLEGGTASSLHALSIPNSITEEIIELLVANNYLFPTITMDSLKQYSFLYEAEGRLTMHGLMREMCSEQLAQQSESRVKRIHELLFNHYLSCADLVRNETGLVELTPEKELFLQEAAYHKKAQSKKEYPGWLLWVTENVYTATTWRVFPGLLSEAAELSDDFFEKAKLAHRLASAYQSVLQFENEEHALTLAYENYMQFLHSQGWNLSEEVELDEDVIISDEIKETLSEINMIGQQRAVCVFNQKMLTRALIYYMQAKNWANRLNLQFDATIYSVFQFKSGRNISAESQIHRLVQYFQTNEEFVFLQFYAAHELAKIFHLQGRYEEALETITVALDCSDSLPKELGEMIGAARLTRAMIAIKLNDLDEAREMLRSAYAIFSTYFNADSWRMSNWHFHMGVLARAEGQYEKAQECFQKALNGLTAQPQNVGIEMHDILIQSAELAEHLVAKELMPAPEAEAYILRAVYFLSRNLVKLIDAQGFYPSLQTAYSRYIAMQQKLGNEKEAQEFNDHWLELQRLQEVISGIKIEDLPHETIDGSVKSLFCSELRQVTSLPSDENKLSMVKAQLPFYSRFFLLQVRIHTDVDIVSKYFLSDGVEYLWLSGNREVVLQVNETDFNLTEAAVHRYLKFYSDCWQMEAGRVLVLESTKDIPWRLDVAVDPGLKRAIENLVDEGFPIEDLGDTWRTRMFTVGNESLYIHLFEVHKKKGTVHIQGGSTVLVNVDQNGEYRCSFSAEGTIVVNRLPLCVDILDRSPRDNKVDLVSKEKIKIRIEQFEPAGVTKEEQSQVRSMASLLFSTESHSSGNVEAFHLPFYKTFRLYRYAVEKTKDPFYYYLLGNGTDFFPLTWTNDAIYQLNRDLQFATEEAVSLYIRFFFDAVVGPIGRFLVVEDAIELPWIENKNVDPALKEVVESQVQKITVIYNNAAHIKCEVTIVFLDSLFRSGVIVNKRTGIVELDDERLVVFTREDDGSYHAAIEAAPPDSEDLVELSLQADPSKVRHMDKVRKALKIYEDAELLFPYFKESPNVDIALLSSHLVSTGFTQEDLKMHKDVMRQYKEMIAQKLPGIQSQLGPADWLVSLLKEQLSDAEDLIGFFSRL